MQLLLEPKQVSQLAPHGEQELLKESGKVVALHIVQLLVDVHYTQELEQALQE